MRQNFISVFLLLSLFALVNYSRAFSPGRSLNIARESCDVDCKALGDGEHPNPKDCGSFCHCSHGVAHFKDCPSILHFNKRLRVCDWPQNANCETKDSSESSESSASSEEKPTTRPTRPPTTTTTKKTTTTRPTRPPTTTTTKKTTTKRTTTTRKDSDSSESSDSSDSSEEKPTTTTTKRPTTTTTTTKVPETNPPEPVPTTAEPIPETPPPVDPITEAPENPETPPESSEEVITESPPESSEEVITEAPESSEEVITEAPESSEEVITESPPESSEEVITEAPESSEEVITEAPESSEEITEAPESSEEVITEAPESSEEVITEAPESSEEITEEPPVLFCFNKECGIYSDPNECDSFYECREDSSTVHHKCPSGLSFNSRVSTCDFPHNSDCNGFSCKGREDGNYPNPFNMHTFYMCSNGIAKLMNCPENLIYNHFKKECDYENIK